MPEEEAKKEDIKEAKIDEVASKINPNIKILKNIGLKDTENSNGQENNYQSEYPVEEPTKGIITVKSKSPGLSKKPRKEIETSINYQNLIYSYQIIILILVLLVGLLAGSFIVSPMVHDQYKTKTLKKFNFNNRSSIFIPVPVFTSDGREYIVEHFEGNKNFIRKWWKAGDLKIYNKSIIHRVIYDQGKKALGLYKNKSPFIGVFGAYLGIDAERYKSIEMLIYGFGKNSGSLEIDLYDDDNNNYYLETDYIDQNILNFDDVFKYSLKVNWKGWKKVVIPFKAFKDGNPLIGDDIYNVNQKKGSGGLVMLDLTVKNHLNCLIDSIKLI